MLLDEFKNDSKHEVASLVVMGVMLAKERETAISAHYEWGTSECGTIGL